MQPKIDDNKLSINDTSSTEGESAIWFQSESVNKIDLEFKNKSKLDEKDWKKEQSSIQ